MAPKLYTQHQYDTVCELLLRASHAYTKVYDRLQAAEVQLTTMRAKQRRAVEVFQRFDAPDTLSGVIEEQRRRGQRP